MADCRCHVHSPAGVQLENEMIVKRIWKHRSKGGSCIHVMTGWYLFGCIPLYVRDDTVREFEN